MLNGLAPPYLNKLVPVSSLPGRRRLRSSFTLQLHIPPYRLSTAGRRSYPVAASIFCSTLPDDVQSAPSVSNSFRRQLKTFLFHQSFPDIYYVLVDFAAEWAVFATLKIFDRH